MSRLDPRLLLQGYATRHFPDGRQPRGGRAVLGRAAQPRDPSARPLPRLALAPPDASARAGSPSPATAISPACITACADREETWINAELERAMLALHGSGHAHSIEVLAATSELVGGLYGVKLGRAFFGESMFSRATDASKVALAWLVARLKAGNFTLLDCQFMTEHLASLGAVSVPRETYVALLSAALGGGGGGAAARPAGVAGDWPPAVGPARFPRARQVARARRAAGAGGPGRIRHLAALGPDVVDRVLDDVERRRFLVEPAGEDPRSSSCRAAARRPGRRRRSASPPPTARSSRTRAGGRSRPSSATDWPG